MTIEYGDVAPSASISAQHFEDSGFKCKFYLHNMKAKGKIKHSSYLVAAKLVIFLKHK